MLLTLLCCLDLLQNASAIRAWQCDGAAMLAVRRARRRSVAQAPTALLTQHFGVTAVVHDILLVLCCCLFVANEGGRRIFTILYHCYCHYHYHYYSITTIISITTVRPSRAQLPGGTDAAARHSSHLCMYVCVYIYIYIYI